MAQIHQPTWADAYQHGGMVALDDMEAGIDIDTFRMEAAAETWAETFNCCSDCGRGQSTDEYVSRIDGFIAGYAAEIGR